MKKKSVRYLLGILITSVALWLSLRNLDWITLKESFIQVNLFWVVFAILMILLSVFIVSWRWQILLKSKSHIPIFDMFRFNIISQYVNIIIPARFGELLRAWLVARKFSLSGSYALGTILIEKLFDSFIVIVLAVFAPLIFTFQTQLKAPTIAFTVFLVIIPLMVLVIWKRQKVLQLIAKIANKFPEKIRIRILIFIEKGIEAFSMLKDIKITLQIFIFTVIVLIIQVLTNLILFKAYNFELSIVEALILQVAILIGMSIPSIPGKIGVFEYTVLLALSMFGIEKSIALSYGLMLHVIAYLPKIILGIIFTVNLKISLKKVETEIKSSGLKEEAVLVNNPGDGGNI